ncbi:MAG: AMP-binding protein [Acidimicrobiales bacterium]|nr:AMP-binding protein [Acidimicrobiales bacterium]
MTPFPPGRSPDPTDWSGPGRPWDGVTLDTVLSGAPPRDDLVVEVYEDGTLGHRWSSADVGDAVAALAGGLVAAGVGRGDVVAWRAPNRIGSLLAYRACWRLGAVAAPVHHRAGEQEAASILARLDPRLVLDVEDLPSGPPVGPDADAAAAEDLAVVLFTSGSSGRPKGVRHTHRSLAYKARSMVTVHGLDARDATLIPAPLAHVSGLLNGVLLPGVVPLKTLLMARWSADRALDLIEAEAVSFMIGPPTFFVELLAAPGFAEERVASLRLVSSGGAGVSPAFVRDAAARLGARVKRSYGSTEAPTVATTLAGDTQEQAATTDGHAADAAELRLGEGGELHVRGPELFEGYLDPEDDVEAFTADGWFRTGDVATLDADGWLTIVGRTKDVIIRGGENVDPGEVEAALEAHPAVRQAVVVGEPDDRLGERLVAVLVADAPLDREKARDWVVAQGLARFKAPDRVVHLDSLPTLPAGKPDRAAITSLVAEGS